MEEKVDRAFRKSRGIGNAPVGPRGRAAIANGRRSSVIAPEIADRIFAAFIAILALVALATGAQRASAAPRQGEMQWQAAGSHAQSTD